MSATSDGPRLPGRSSDSYAQWDAAYVLGALSPDERLEFEEHLAGCTGCQAAVAEMAVLPGLLAQVAPEDAAQLAGPDEPADEPPPTLLPAVLTTARRQRRRLSRNLLGLAAALLLVLGGVGLGQVWPPQSTQGPQQLAFAALEPSDITANVRLVPTKGGTEVEVECQYGGTSDPDPAGPYARYSVVVTDRTGHQSKIKDWDVKADKIMRPTATTPLEVSQIRDVEIWDTAANEPVLRATRG